MARLEPLRSGAPLISSEELAQVDGDWIKWRAEWVRRRKIFNECVQAGYRVSIGSFFPSRFVCYLFGS
jgi:hypothetical protein